MWSTHFRRGMDPSCKLPSEKPGRRRILEGRGLLHKGVRPPPHGNTPLLLHSVARPDEPPHQNTEKQGVLYEDSLSRGVGCRNAAAGAPPG